MKLLAYLFRKAKVLFVRLNLHVIVEPFTWFFEMLFYLSKFSKWRKSIKLPEFCDFYNKRPDYINRYKLYSYIFEKENLSSEINYIEFGVAGGDSLRWWMQNNKNYQSIFTGFDTFTGLPEDWSVRYKKGAMSTEGKLPEVPDDRVQFQVGLFQETLPGFLKTMCNDKRNIIHLDADLYTSTLFALTSIAPYLKAADILIFDDFFAPTHEFKAFSEFISSFYLKYEVIGAVNNFMQTAFKIII